MTIRIADVEAAGQLLGGLACGAVSGALVGVADAALAGLIGELEQVGRVVDTLRVAVAAEVEERSRPELGRAGMAQHAGHVKAAHLIEQLTRVSQGEAVRRVRLGALIRPGCGLDGQLLPARFARVAAAMGAGELGIDAATQITRCLNQALRTATVEAVEAAEEALVEAARTECADLVGVHAAVWREALDPDGAVPRDERLRARRSFVLGRERDGMTPIWGLADPTAGALLRAMFSEGANPAAKPRFLSEADQTAGTELTLSADCEWVETVKDPRTTEQRQFDILLGTLTAGLRSTETGGSGLRPLTTVMAVVTLKDLKAGTGVAWLDDITEPVSAITAQQLACDAGYREILLGANGEVLHLGVTRRLFSAAQRKALAVRDGGCAWGLCSAPPAWCEAHHVIEWEHGGKTDIDNGMLLCSRHHHELHAGEHTIRMFDGKPRILAPPWIDPTQTWHPLGLTRALLTA